MKNILVFFVFTTIWSIPLHSQTIGWNYQAIIRDSNGEPLSKSPVDLQFQILNEPNQAFNPAYAETHADLMTDTFGLVTAVVGKGAPDHGFFDTIEWHNGPHYLKVLVRIPPGAAFIPVGDAQEIVFPPYSGGDWTNIGDSVLFTKKKVGIGGINNNPEIALQVLNPQNSTTLLVGDYGNDNTYIRMTTSAFHDGWGEIQTVRNGSAFGSTVINPKGGNVGINTFTPQRLLQLGDDVSGVSLDADRYTPNSGSLRFGDHSGWKFHIGRSRESVGGSLNTNEQGAIMTFLDNGNVGINNTNPGRELDVNGTTRTKILEITGGDVAEARYCTTKEKLPAGSVVVFDEKLQGKIRLTAKPYDKKVAGVISGAGKYFAGVCLMQEELAKGALPVAQVGSVEVWCVGPVEVGDLLTTSEVHGHAMAITDPLGGIGCTIGKAMTTLAAGERGLVEMQVEKH